MGSYNKKPRMGEEVIEETLAEAKAGRWVSYPAGPPYIEHVEYLQGIIRSLRAYIDRLEHPDWFPSERSL